MNERLRPKQSWTNDATRIHNVVLSLELPEKKFDIHRTQEKPA